MKDEIILYLFALKLEELREIKAHVERLIEIREEKQVEKINDYGNDTRKN